MLFSCLLSRILHTTCIKTAMRCAKSKTRFFFLGGGFECVCSILIPKKKVSGHLGKANLQWHFLINVSLIASFGQELSVEF